MDGAGAAADPVHAVEYMFYVRGAAVDLPWVGGGGIRVPEDFDPAGGADAVWPWAGRAARCMAAAVAAAWDFHGGPPAGHSMAWAAKRPGLELFI